MKNKLESFFSRWGWLIFAGAVLIAVALVLGVVGFAVSSMWGEP